MPNGATSVDAGSSFSPKSERTMGDHKGFPGSRQWARTDRKPFYICPRQFAQTVRL